MPQVQRLSGRDPDLPLDQVLAGDHLRDRVFDLDAGVDLDEVEFLVLVEQEFHGTGAMILGLLDQPQCRGAQTVPRLLVQHRAGAFLDELLMPPLNGTVALVKMQRVARPVGQDLHLDMPRLLDVFFKIECPVFKRILRFGLSRGKRRPSS